MKIVIDTNVLLSALIKDSITRKILLQSKYEFFYPQLAFAEVVKHKKLITKKSGLKNEEINKLIQYLFSNINIVPLNKNSKFKEAIIILGKIDPADVIFLALALNLKANIWSNDNHFEKQKTVKVLKTRDMIKLLQK